MSRKLSVVLFFCFLATWGVWGQTATLKGIAAGYGGTTLSVYTLKDFITEDRLKVGDIHFQQDGAFDCAVQLPGAGTFLCFTEFGAYHAMIYLEAGKTYNIQFPPKKERTEAEKRNPFENLLPVWFLIEQQPKDDINALIRNFEQAYMKYEDKYFNEIFVNHSRSSVELIQREMADQFPRTQNRFFEDYKRYRLANLEFALNQGKSAEFLGKYFGKVDPKPLVPAYYTLFDQVFTNYFSFLGNSIHGQKIKALVDAGDVQPLVTYLMEKNTWTEYVCRWIILKALKDAYYSGQFSKPAVLQMFHQIPKSNWSDKEKEVASSILQKMLYLSVGSDAPVISLERAGQPFSLASLGKQLIYLHFTDVKNPVCVQHLETLKPFAEASKASMTVVYVTDKKVSEEDARKWPGIFVTTNSDGLSAYKVKTFPTSYLIGKDGKMLASPAQNPMNGLGNQVKAILEKERTDKMRSGAAK